MPGTISRRLEEIGVELPAASKPVANFVPCIQSGQTLFVSGQIPSWNGQLKHVGKVGQTVTLDEARMGARLCALNLLASVQAFLGRLDLVARVCQVHGFVNAAPDFAEAQAVVIVGLGLVVAVF